MRISRRTLVKLTAAAVAAPIVLRHGAARAAEVTLRLHHFLPAKSNVHSRLLDPWAKKVGELTGGKAAVADHLTIGANSVITGNSGVASNVPPGRIMMGYPAVRMDQNVEMYKALRRLPRLVQRLEAAQKAVSNPQATD